MGTHWMKAWGLRALGRENLKLDTLPRPDPGPNELLVRVGAVSLNYRDKLVVDGKLLPEPPTLPFIPVSDFCGTVVAVGPAVSAFHAGDRVVGNFWTEWIDGVLRPDMLGTSLGGPLPGALAEFVTIPADAAVAVPESISDAEAATLPIAALTAWAALTEAGDTEPGQTVLVQGTGGVALAGLQIASAMGALVIVTSRHAEKRDRALALGAWAVVDTGNGADWSDQVLAATAGAGVDHVLELAGGDNVTASVNALAPAGRISLIGFMAGSDLRLDALPIMLRRARLQGVSVGHRRALERLVRFMEAKRLHPVIDAVYAFDRVHDAFAHLDRGPFGKVVIETG